jgi:hypothetical protein
MVVIDHETGWQIVVRRRWDGMRALSLPTEPAPDRVTLTPSTL